MDLISMNNSEKRNSIQKLLKCKKHEDCFYQALEAMGELKTNYSDYMTTEPINCNEELKRLPNADYELCTALLTMLLREDHFCNGSFMRRYEAGQVKMILDRMLELLK